MRIVSLLLTGFVAIMPAHAGPAREPINFRIVDTSDIAMPATVNGQGPFLFLLDTGSSGSAVSSGLARRLGLVTVGKTLMVTPSGEAAVPTAQLHSIDMGGARSIGVVVMVLEQIGRPAAHIDGLIGLDILRSRTFTIDYRQKQLIWRTWVESAALPGHRVPLTVEDGRALVTLNQRSGEDGLLRMIPDSGADGLVLFDRPGRLLPPFTSLDTVGLRTLSDQREVRRIRVDGFDIGDLRLHDQLALLVDRPESARELGDGLLPLHLFARVTFNGPLGYLVVEGK